MIRGSRALAALLLVCAMFFARPAAAAETFSGYGSDAARVLVQRLFARGYWRLCLSGCSAVNSDWGADSLTYTSYLYWRATRSPQAASMLRRLAQTAQMWTACAGPISGCSWSDVPEWDAIADVREYEATGDSRALAKAESAYDYVAQSPNFALGACPQIHYQHPRAGGGGLKTLETDANAVKAALLLYGATRRVRYLDDAKTLYAAVRAHFLDPRLPLYTTYVFDDNGTCTQIPRQFFGSVNGDMIFNGLDLYRYTAVRSYLEHARATVHAVSADLSDGRGVYAQLQAENDVGEPLVEAMDAMAHSGDSEAAAWLLRNARAALFEDRAPNGFYGRFFDGPPPRWNVTAWQTNGGLALAIVAAQLAPAEHADGNHWLNARFVQRTMTRLPSSVLTIHAAGVAVIGTIGDRCCEPGRARVLIDGVETIDRTGIWQNKSSSGRRIPNAVLFAWRWNAPGTHTIQFLPPAYNAKEGGAYLHVSGYYVLTAASASNRSLPSGVSSAARPGP
jgi:hypothetical protein